VNFERDSAKNASTVRVKARTGSLLERGRRRVWGRDGRTDRRRQVVSAVPRACSPVPPRDREPYARHRRVGGDASEGQPCPPTPPCNAKIDTGAYTTTTVEVLVRRR
jgi:hypothetical protein